MSPTHRVSHISGTLNTVLANKNGIVIASDSRGSWRDDGGVHRDDGFQKLFRTAKRSGLAIAGLLATPAEPYGVETASTILSRFGTNGLDDGRGDPFLVTSWVELQFGIHLRRLAAVLSTYMHAPQDCQLFVTIAGYDKHNTAQISQIQFSGGMKPITVNGKPVWIVTPIVTPLTTVDGFVSRTAGVTRIADAMLAGQIAVQKLAVATYLSASASGLAGELGIDDLVALTEAIFEETASQEEGVGGELQMAIISSDGKPQWNLKPTNGPNLRLGGAELVIGGVNPLCGGPQTEWPAHYEVVQNFDALDIDSLYVATVFHDLLIPLNENQFFGCNFDRCTFKYSGAGRLGFAWNLAADCNLEIQATNARIPPEVRYLQAECPSADETSRHRPRIPKRSWQFG